MIVRLTFHSLADVDESYISAIMDRVDLGTVRWTVSVFGNIPERQARFESYGIAQHLVRYVEMSDFDQELCEIPFAPVLAKTPRPLAGCFRRDRYAAGRTGKRP